MLLCSRRGFASCFDQWHDQDICVFSVLMSERLDDMHRLLFNNDA